jgi:molybdopterin-guanine dinucleotide biosynthesis protein B
MLVLAIYGPAGAGKTRLLEELIPKLSSKYRVATVKHIPTEIEWDTPGKDTYRHRSAGAELVVGDAANSTVFFFGKLKLWEILAKLTGFDIVLLEGYSSAKELPKVSVGVSQCDRAPNTVLAYEGETRELLHYIESHVAPHFSLRVDGGEIKVNRFVREFIKNTVLGMLRSLKKCQPRKTVVLEFSVS